MANPHAVAQNSPDNFQVAAAILAAVRFQTDKLGHLCVLQTAFHQHQRFHHQIIIRLNQKLQFSAPLCGFVNHLMDNPVYLQFSPDQTLVFHLRRNLLLYCLHRLCFPFLQSQKRFQNLPDLPAPVIVFHSYPGDFIGFQHVRPFIRRQMQICHNRLQLNPVLQRPPVFYILIKG